MKPTPLFLPLLLALCFSSLLSAQDYHPFPETTARWSHVTRSHPEAKPQVRRGSYYQTGGDTLIDGHTYQKLFHRDTWREITYYVGPDETDVSTYNDNNPLELIGGLRQDIPEKKVYYRHFESSFGTGCVDPSFLTENEDILLYDFDLVIGDLHPYYAGEMELISIDSISLTNGEVRKRYNFGGGDGHQFIEGIGANFGLFGMSYGIFEGGCSLRCFREDGTYTYLPGVASTFDCDSILLVGTTDLINPLPQLEVFPNPFSNSLNITGLDASHQDYQLSISNMLGEKVLYKAIPFQQSVEVAVPDLPAGVYIISVFIAPNIRVSRKLIKM